MAEIWPLAPVVVSEQVKKIITRFFEISDSTDPTSGQLFANEIFTKDGVFKTHKTLIFKGHDEIAAARGKNNPIVASRSHKLVRVYAKDSPATDLVVQGSFETRLKDGNSVEFDFNARFVVAPGQVDEARVQYVEVWTDPTDMLAAFEKARQTLAAKE